MKPSFALNITDTSIGLLHRTARGWLQVGETAFDTADLAEALGYLRGSALGLSPGGLTTKLVLPNSQIKYLELDAPGPDDADRRNQIRAGLVGRTPYNVEDLVFDWSGSGPKVQVAVVARETLDEAEAFAAEHRFNPVAFVGKPQPGDFKGEPWFGQTKISATVLEKGEKVDRDAEPVQVASRDLPKSHPAAAKTASSEVSEETAPNSPSENDKPTRAQRRAAAAAAAEQARLAEAAAQAADPAPEASVVPPPAREPEAEPVSQDLANAFPEILDDATETGAPWTAPALPITARPDTGLPASAAETPRVEIQAAEMAVQSAPASVTSSVAFPEGTTDTAKFDDGATVLDDLPPAPSAAIMAAFASRRANDVPNPKPFGGAVAEPEPARTMSPGALSTDNRDLADRLSGKSTPPPLSRPKVGSFTPPVSGLRADATGAAAMPDTATPKPGAAKGSTAFVTAPSIPGSRKRKSLQTDAASQSGQPEPRKSLTKPGGTFASSKDRGKPRYLGWILTGLLLVFLALIAAWSSFVTGSNDAAQTGTAVVSATPSPATEAPATQIPASTDTEAPATQTPASTDTVAADVPAVDDEMLADAQDPADFAAPADATADPTADAALPQQQDATVADATPDVAPAADTAPNPAPDAALSAADTPAPVPEAAPVGIAASESPTATPPTEAQDEVFLTAIDAPPLVLDPRALPTPAATNDALPLPQLEPPPFGTVYQFDADGRIRPTPEGIITPEGVRLVAGKPSLVPPPRPDDLIAALSAATAGTAAAAAAIAPVVPGVTTAAPFPSDPALAEARPRPRPANLVPAAQPTDDSALSATPGTTGATSLRPLPRPASVLAAGEAARQSTDAAAQTAQSAAVEAAVQASYQPDANASPLAVSVSRKPAARPKDMTRAVEAAVAVAVRTPEITSPDTHSEGDAEPETVSAAPSIPTRASVAKQATYVNAINLSKINLIGVYGSKSSPYALIRQANGRYKKVKVGDSIDGGRIATISGTEVRYEKSGRIVSLKMPKT